MEFLLIPTAAMHSNMDARQEASLFHHSESFIEPSPGGLAIQCSRPSLASSKQVQAGDGHWLRKTVVVYYGSVTSGFKMI